MYGMIHQALRGMVLDAGGETAWERVERLTAVGPGDLISTTLYTDELTLALVDAAAQALEIDGGELLVRFGRYWVQFAQRGRYGALMTMLGDDMAEFIGNLDRLHKSVAAAMPGAATPRFTVIRHGEQALVVRYASERAGLEQFVVGLLRGLLDRFGLDGEIAVAQVSPGVADFHIAPLVRRAA